MKVFMNWSKILVICALLSDHCGYSMDAVDPLKILATQASVNGALQVMNNPQKWQHEEGRLNALFHDSCQQIIQALQARINPLVIHTLGGPHGHKNRVWSACFSPDGQRIVTASTDETAKVWDAHTGALVRTLGGPRDHQRHEGCVFSAQFSPDGQRIVTASIDYTAKVWDAQTGALLRTLGGPQAQDPQRHKGWVFLAQFSPDGQLIVTASADNTAKVWNAQTGGLVHTLDGHQGHQGLVYSACFSPNGQFIVTASRDNTARVWNAQTGALLRT